MNLTIDSNVKNIIFNGNDVQKLIFNGVEVWSKVAEIYENYGYKYLTFEFITSGTLSIIRGDSSGMSKTLYYRKNGGSWTSISVENYYTEKSINVLAGDILECYATGAWAYNNTTNNVKFGGTAEFNLYGNIRSITDGINFYNKPASYAPYMFQIFSGTKVVDASNCIIDYTYVSSNYFRGMFRGCTKLTKGPIVFGESNGNYSHADMFYGCTNLVEGPKLFSKKLNNYAYDSMFYNCSKLNYVEAYFTTTPGTNYTSNWMYGVQTTSGTFVKNSAATWNVNGVNGVPSKWTKTSKTLPDAFYLPGAYDVNNIVASDTFTGTLYLSKDGIKWYGKKFSDAKYQDADTFMDAAAVPYNQMFIDKGYTVGKGRLMVTEFNISETGDNLYVKVDNGGASFMLCFMGNNGYAGNRLPDYAYKGKITSLCSPYWYIMDKFDPDTVFVYGKMSATTADDSNTLVIDKNTNI